MSDNSVIDLTDAAKPLVEDYAQELGRRLPKMLEELESWLMKHGLKLPAEVIELAKQALNKAPKELIEMAAGVVQVPRKIFPSGKLGDVLHKYANDAVDEIGRGASEKSAPDGKDGKDGAAKPTDKAGGAPADPLERLGYVNNGRWYPTDCTHVGRPWSGGKGNTAKPPADITLKEALARNHSYCRDCIRDLDQGAAKPVTKPEPKAEPKDDPSKLAFKEHPLPNADHTVFDLWQRFYDDMEATRFGDASQYHGSWDDFLRLTKHDPELKGKFILAFNRRGTYEQFKKLVLSRSDHWHDQLDLLLGTSKPSASYLTRKAEEERAQWEKAIKRITERLRGANVEGRKAIDEDKAELEALKARFHGKSHEGKASKAWTLTIVCLAIMLGAVLLIWHST